MIQERIVPKRKETVVRKKFLEVIRHSYGARLGTTCFTLPGSQRTSNEISGKKRRMVWCERFLTAKVGNAPIENLYIRARTDRLAYVRDLLYELVVRDVKLRYKRSVLGIGWSLLNPLAQLLVFYFIFDLLLPLKIPNYTPFLFTGVLVWSWFQSSLQAATGSVVDNRELVKRPGFPATVLPPVTVTAHLIHFLLALPILLLFIMHGNSQFTSAILILPLLIALQLGLILGLGYLVATLHVTFRDTQYLVGVLLQLLFFLTPVFYRRQHYSGGLSIFL